MRCSAAVRHWVSGIFIAIAVGMVILGQSVFAGRLKDYDYVFYWGGCMIMTLFAAVAALWDMAAIRRESRQQHHQLVEETFKKVDPDSLSDGSNA